MTTREHIIKDLIDTKHAFDSTGIPFLLYHGNLLGLVKYGDIMEWDTDIDLAVTRTVTDYDKGMLTADMLVLGFEKTGGRRNTMRFHRGVDVDIFFFHAHGVWYQLGQSKRFKRRYPRAFLEETQWVDFLGESFRTPLHIKDYMEWEYGPNWESQEIRNKTEWKRMVGKRRTVGHW
jgi:hypothetical protein